jgi:3-hydroxyisobutyrate dehydrogenase-like beta-hydroxyacid dehydrogenase
VELAVEAARVSAEFGIDAALFARTVRSCSGANYALDLVAAMGSADALLGATGHFVHKDVSVARDVADELGVDLGTIASVTTPILGRTSPR